MVSSINTSTPQVLNNCISVQGAASYCGYSTQYLRSDKKKGVKIGQMWLVDKAAPDFYIKQAQNVTDHRFGPK